MSKRDWLLILAALKGPAAGLDPVRVQKGMFLLAMEGDLPAQERYEFEPYNYGPMSKEVYRDLDELVVEGLVERTQAPGQAWPRYRATERGRQTAQRLVDESGPDAEQSARKLYEIKRDIVDKTFSGLLNDVYDRYPRYAEKSVFHKT
ncbi:MAG: PadR family transcriptional regulator [Actinobacteria bacterium]|nr:PadR family transcriptional regulator [Actinomycetota bacterium]